MISLRVNGLTLLQFRLFAASSELDHAISTRLGGESPAPYSTLNLGRGVGDDPALVLNNRRRLLEALGLKHQDVVTSRQVHGDKVIVVDTGETARGALGDETALSAADGMLTATPGVALMVVVADCVPILLFDPKQGVVGAVHAGWRGTVQGIAYKSVAGMVETLNSRPQDILAGIGPSIGPCCYEVDEPVLTPLRERFPTSWQRVAREKGGDKAYLDLWEANRLQLLEAGLKVGHIEVARLCTACYRYLLYSERREGRPTGRFGAVIGLRSETQMRQREVASLG